jgi:AbrB family looped-hinge helix DNA binding protein
MGIVQLDDKGRVTLPQDVRKRLKLEGGDFLKITVMPYKRIQIVPVDVVERGR